VNKTDIYIRYPSFRFDLDNNCIYHHKSFSSLHTFIAVSRHKHSFYTFADCRELTRNVKSLLYAG
jgi:hypothetical protein